MTKAHPQQVRELHADRLLTQRDVQRGNDVNQLAAGERLSR